MVSLQTMSQDDTIKREKRTTKDEIRARQTEKKMVVPFSIRDIPTGCNPTPIATEGGSNFSWDNSGVPGQRWDQTLDVEDLEEDMDHGLSEEYLVGKFTYTQNLGVC